MINRQFLAADTALLPAMAEALVQQAATGDCIDLRDTLVVLPTTRSIGTLRTLLLEAAHKPLLAPDICTIGALAPRCIVPTRTLAPKAAVKKPVGAALSNSFGFGGTNASVVFVAAE